MFSGGIEKEQWYEMGETKILAKLLTKTLEYCAEYFVEFINVVKNIQHNIESNKLVFLSNIEKAFVYLDDMNIQKQHSGEIPENIDLKNLEYVQDHIFITKRLLLEKALKHIDFFRAKFSSLRKHSPDVFVIKRCSENMQQT